MSGTLIVSGGEKGRELLCGVLASMQRPPAQVLTGGTECRRMLAETDCELILINTPLADEFGHELAVYAAQTTGAGVVLLVKAELADEVSARVEDAGVLVVSKPINKALLFGSIKLALAANKRLCGLRQKNDALQQKIEDIRLIDRAKCALIQYRQLTEVQAHKYIEREAMDGRKTRREVAQAILRMYEGEY